MNPIETNTWNETLDAVQVEAGNAINKHGFAQTPNNPMMLDTDKLVILVEEIGEIARGLTYDNRETPTKLRHELIQLATMALMWADSLHPMLRLT